VTSLYARKTSEVELWPSQLEAAERSTDVRDDLVVALPTSAGKTRIAELAALMTVAQQKRVLIVTPLRALSAQTERSFRETFGPLGFTVSSLYGASGVSETDEDALRSKNIVIATPEKLDFALRNDPSIIDDIGLIVLDEGHMIGPTEREIRYETLVQRLLRRSDAASRRIVCLSAILPEGDQLDDLTAWIRNDEPGGPVTLRWRQGSALFVDLPGMRAWLEGAEVTALTDADDWPTPETAALWQRFRSDMLSGGIRTREISEIRLALDHNQPRPPNGLYRVEEVNGGEAWICTPDFRRLAKLRRRVRDRAHGLLSARFIPGANRAIVKRYGRGRAAWIEPED